MFPVFGSSFGHAGLIKAVRVNMSFTHITHISLLILRLLTISHVSKAEKLNSSAKYVLGLC